MLKIAFQFLIHISNSTDRKFPIENALCQFYSTDTKVYLFRLLTTITCPKFSGNVSCTKSIYNQFDATDNDSTSFSTRESNSEYNCSFFVSVSSFFIEHCARKLVSDHSGHSSSIFQFAVEHSLCYGSCAV